MLAKLGASVLIGLALGLVAHGARRADRQGHRRRARPRHLRRRAAADHRRHARHRAVRGARRRRRRGHAQPGRRDHRLARLPVRAREPAADHPRASTTCSCQVRPRRGQQRPRRAPTTPSDLLGQVPAGLVFAGYCAIFIVIGIVLMRRRDITA